MSEDDSGSDHGDGKKACLPADLLDRLNKLAEGPAPKELAMGAMCYSIAPPPDREEYVCPKCGERTLYATSNECSKVCDVRVASDLMRELSRSDVILDESSFCKNCSPDTPGPSMALVVHYADGTDHRTDCVELVDVQLVKVFFDGHSKHDGGMGGEVPLKAHAARLATLLLPSEMAEEFRAAHSTLSKLKSAIKKTFGGS